MASKVPNTDSVTPERWRSAMAGFPTGVTVITTPGHPGPAGLVANAVTSLSLRPPMVLACFDRSSRTLGAVEASGSYAINVLGEGAEQTATSFARKTSYEEKWAGVKWSARAQGPQLEEAITWIGCTVAARYDGGDHVIVTGTVEAIEQRDGIPLLFHHGAYRRL